MKQLLNYIDGKLVPPQAGNWLDNVDPATGQVYSHIPDSDAADVEAAVAAAKAAFESYSRTTREERVELLESCVATYQKRYMEIAEAIREEMSMAELSKKSGAHPTQIGTWKRAAIENMSTACTRRGAAPEQVSIADVDKLHSKIGQLVVERDFLAEASHQLLGTRGKKW